MTSMTHSLHTPGETEEERDRASGIKRRMAGTEDGGVKDRATRTAQIEYKGRRVWNIDNCLVNRNRLNRVATETGTF